MSDIRTQVGAVLFRPAPGGYVYRQPYRRPFGDAPHYLVNEDQKAAIIDHTVAKRPILFQFIMWGSLCAMVAIAGVGVWAYTGHDSPNLTDTIGMAVLTVVQIAAAFAIFFWWKRRRLQPLLATLPRTDLRITQSEMRAAMTNTTSTKQLMIAAVASVFAAIAMLVNVVIQFMMGQPMAYFWLSLCLVFAGLSIYYFRQLIARKTEG
jgi:hypothetical protein